MTNKEKAERYRARKTQAVPKHTLFGTALEQHDKEDLEKIENLDVTSVDVNKPYKRTYSYKTLPENVKSGLPGNAALEHSKEEADRQREQASRARDLLKSLEERSLFFNSPPPKGRTTTSAVTSRPPPQWITEKDIEHADQINQVGLSKKLNYDRQRHARKPPVHQYALIGDVMRAGEMEFPAIDSNGQPQQTQSASPAARRASPNMYYSRLKAGQTTHLKQQKSVIQLPPNIRHAFGSRICDNLLADPETVHNTMTNQEKIRNANKRLGDRQPVEAASVSPVDPAYHALGCALRQDIFPGYSYGNKLSTVNDVYSPQVFARRYADPEQYRYQRDAVSTWNEYNVIFLRLSRQWEDYKNSLPKFSANWDRDAKRERAPPQEKPPPKPKPKPRKPPPPTKKKENQSEEAFSEVTFVTPPVTPPPPRPPSPQKLPEVKRDDEFWDFYNQGV